MTRSCLTINADICPGTPIGDACRELMRVAKLLETPVEGEFNDVKLFADPEGTADTLEKQWHRVYQKESLHRFAHSNENVSI